MSGAFLEGNVTTNLLTTGTMVGPVLSMSTGTQSSAVQLDPEMIYVEPEY